MAGGFDSDADSLKVGPLSDNDSSGTDLDFRSLVDASPEGFVVIREGFCIYVNASFARFLGRTREDVMSELFLDLLHETYRTPMTKWLEQPASMGRHEPSEYGFLDEHGKRRTLQLTPIWLDSFGGRPARAFIARDVAQVKQMQADLLLADRMMTVGALAAGVAHEINNPMSFVIGNLHYALSEIADKASLEKVDLEELRTAMDEALEGAERISRIVKNFHTFSRADHASTTALSLPAIVESALTAAFVQIRRKAQLVRQL
ncbi:MAG: PAS domain S-box protein, partial [Myxococcota bacterium]